MKKIIITFTAALTLVGIGCKKGFLDVNKNPNQSTNASPELVFPAALANTAARLDNAIGTFSFISAWMGYVAASGSYALSSSDVAATYKLTNTSGAGIFQGTYDNLADYNYVEKAAHDQQKPFLEGMAKIMKALNFAELVDLYNNVPYTEALQGTSILHPVYDDASAIYGDLFKQITAGMDLIKTSPDVPDSKTDIMFAADAGADADYIKSSWLKFGNSLKLRMLLQMSEMGTKPAYFETEKSIVAADQSSIGFLTVDATVNPGYANSAGKQNPFFGSNINVSGTYINDFWRANAFAIAFYNSTNDPRLEEVYAPIPSGAFVGNTVGSGNNAVGSASSTFGPGVVRGFDQDASIMLAAESYFEQSEAALRGWITGDPQALYEQGVTESFRYDQVPDYATAAQDYYTSGASQTDWTVNTTFDQQLTLIMKQKWAAENMINVLVPYNDYRRFVNTSHSPKPLADIPLSVSNSVDVLAIPYRLLYPDSEAKTNAANVPQLSGQFPGHSNKIFWMP
jgi:Starch-binding associating with outer membrane